MEPAAEDLSTAEDLVAAEDLVMAAAAMGVKARVAADEAMGVKARVAAEMAPVGAVNKRIRSHRHPPPHPRSIRILCPNDHNLHKGCRGFCP
jgi:hypothetical protein